MDRALNLSLLAGALGDVGGLPSPGDLRAMLAQAEVAAFFRSEQEVDEDLLRTAWHLHQVGTVRPQLQAYTAERQVQANAVAAHIFDLALESAVMQSGEQLVTTFAAQISSIRGDRTPNATALGRRLPLPSAQLETQPGRASLELACALLTLDRRRTLDLLRSLTQQVEALAATTNEGLASTGLASAAGVIDGTRLLQRYLTDGDTGQLAAAQNVFLQAANNPSSRRDLDSRWVAAHLVDLCDDFGASSVWAILPDGTPPAVGRAMTLGDPPIMTLWPPQVQLLTDPDQNPMQAGVVRSVLTFPTSAGKTLLSQLLIAHHLAVEGTGVCFVAPSHSLCREVRDGLDRRLWAIRRSVEADGPLGDPENTHSHVIVMTPEKLAARLRADEQALLAEFGLFVLDEAHLVDDESRGWTFESTVSRLHALTLETHHRIVLLSAALGGTASVQSWLATGSATTAATRTWRGPRRLHATYMTSERPETRRTVAPTGRQRVARELTDMYGDVNLYVDQGAAIAERSALVGTVERTSGSKSAIRPSMAVQLLPIVELASRSGSVLTVHATKKSAENLAAAVAAERPEKLETAPLVRLAEQRLGATHGLVSILRSGVAYHHAALPADLQAEIEDAVRQGVVDVICATSTLIEGINLPVRTVVVCERGYWDGSTFHAYISPAGLMNAAGRAGRAGRETEGWVVLNHQYAAPDARRSLLDLDKPQDIHSTLNTPAALQELATYEALVHETGALVLQNVPQSVDGFLSYCWYLADAHEALSATEMIEAVAEGFRHTLAWQQLPVPLRLRWESLAQVVCQAFEQADHGQRRRWARSGLRLSANPVLEDVAKASAAGVGALGADGWNDPVMVLERILGEGRLSAILSLTADRDYRFKVKRWGAVELADVDLLALILDWVRGAPLADLVADHLAGVDADDEALRFEQLSTFLTRICEHHLPFTLGTLLEWISAALDTEICPNLAAYVHYGAPRPQAVHLLKRGVRSRRLAVVAGAAAHQNQIGADGLQTWLANLGPTNWRKQLQAGPAEVTDLLQFVHDPAAAISAALLDGESRGIRVDPTDVPFTTSDELAIGWAVSDEERPRPLLVLAPTGEPVARIRPAEYRHLQVLVDAGFLLLASPTEWTDNGHVVAIEVQAQVD